MAGYYLVIKNIYGNRYYYYQRTWREGKKVKCHCVYVGRADSGIRPASRATFNAQPKNFTPAERLADKVNRAQTPYDVARLSKEARLASSPKASMNAGMKENINANKKIYCDLHDLTRNRYFEGQWALQRIHREEMKAHGINPEGRDDIYSSNGFMTTYFDNPKRKLVSTPKPDGTIIHAWYTYDDDKIDPWIPVQSPSINVGMKKNTLRPGVGGPLDLHENHTFSNACPTCMGEEDNTTLEAGVQLYARIPLCDKLPETLRDKLRAFTDLSLQHKEYEALAAHLFVPKTGLFNSYGQALTFARELTGQHDISAHDLQEFFRVLHVNADEIKRELY